MKSFANPPINNVINIGFLYNDLAITTQIYKKGALPVAGYNC